MKKENSDAFFALVRGGLWENSVRLLTYGNVDFTIVTRLAEEQSVMGLVAAGIEHVTDIKVTKKDALPFIGQTFQLEQKNQAMNIFIAGLVDEMREEGIYTLLVKGQGVAQCYERPYWRSSGDVDLFLNEENYKKAKNYLTPLATNVEKEYIREKHLGMNIDTWEVELHGRLYSGLSSRIDKELDDVYRDTFFCGNIRSWQNGNTQVFLMAVDNDIFYVFTHILQHFYMGGIGLRQICDWCRLLWVYHEKFDVKKLEMRLKRARLINAWRAFGAFSVDYLGMPAEAMPFYDSSARWHRKAKRICSFVMEVGNFGHNRDLSYYGKKSYFMQKAISFGQRIGDLLRHASIFPHESMRFFPRIIYNGLVSAARGE